MSVKSPKVDFDLNFNFALISISDFLADLSMINDASIKLMKLDDYIHELEIELRKIDGLKRQMPLCMLMMNEGIERLKEERMRTEAEARLLTRESLPLKGGDNSNEDAGAKKSSNCNEEKNWMSSAQLWTTNVQYENFDTKKQDFVSSLKSDVKQENGSASKSSYGQICRKLKLSEGFAGPRQRQSGLIIKERNNLLPVIGLPAPVSRVKLGPTDTNLKRNISKTSTGLSASVSWVELGPTDMDLKQNANKTSTSFPASAPKMELSPTDMNWRPNMNKISTGSPTSVPVVELGSTDMNLKGNISKTSTGSSLTTNPGKKPRPCWSPELHKEFINAVQQLGGPNASPSPQMTENMQADGFSKNEVKSNLQICSRLKGSEGHIGGFQRQSGVIINENKNLLAVNGPSSSVPGMEKGNIAKTSSDSSLTADAEKKPRRCWSNELHSVFVNALQHLGGPYAATPKQIRERMQVDDLTNDEVKSHLQKYRLHITKSPERSTASSRYIWPGRGCRSRGSTSQSVSGPLNGYAKEVSTADNAPKNTARGDENAAKRKKEGGDEKSKDHN